MIYLQKNIFAINMLLFLCATHTIGMKRDHSTTQIIISLDQLGWAFGNKKIEYQEKLAELYEEKLEAEKIMGTALIRGRVAKIGGKIVRNPFVIEGASDRIKRVLDIVKKQQDCIKTISDAIIESHPDECKNIESIRDLAEGATVSFDTSIFDDSFKAQLYKALSEKPNTIEKTKRFNQYPDSYLNMQFIRNPYSKLETFPKEFDYKIILKGVDGEDNHKLTANYEHFLYLYLKRSSRKQITDVDVEKKFYCSINHDYKNYYENEKIIKLHNKVMEKDTGCYSATISAPWMEYSKFTTFFPADLSPREIMCEIESSINDPERKIKPRPAHNDELNAIEVVGRSNRGIKIETIIINNQDIKTSMPIVSL